MVGNTIGLGLLLVFYLLQKKCCCCRLIFTTAKWWRLFHYAPKKNRLRTLLSLSLSHQHLSQFYAKFFCKNFCRVLWWRGRAVHLKYTVFICLFEYDGFWVIKVSDLSVFLKFWLNFSFWILWHEISQKSWACMENITSCYPQNLLKS